MEIWEAGSVRRCGREGFWAVLLVGSVEVIVREEVTDGCYVSWNGRCVWYDGGDIAIDADEVHEFFSKSRRGSYFGRFPGSLSMGMCIRIVLLNGVRMGVTRACRV